MSLPYCLTNPKLRLFQTKWGFVTLERVAPQSYDVFMDGIRLGHVGKFKSWFADDDATAFKTRLDAINYVIVSWYRRPKTTGDQS